MDGLGVEMGKRSDFERIDKDFYRTIDPRAVRALGPHLPAHGFRFAEPCVGEKDLARELWNTCGGYPAYTSDISEGVDALTITKEQVEGCDYIITNPPWSRNILHSLIMHLSELLPTWLLFDADWAHTKQSVPYMKRCAKIVSVGRLVWIPGTNTSGKENCAWYLFDARHIGHTQFYGR